MINERDFIENKIHTMDKLKKAKKENKVDKQIIPILDIINSSDNFYTSSSCYGRIVLLEIPRIGDKKNAIWLGKWHRTIEKDEFFDALKNAKSGFLWLLAQAPIIHVFAKNLDFADVLVKKSVSCGFKHSAFKSVEKNIVVEITSTERLDSPVGKDKILFCNDEYLDMLIDISNNVIVRSTEKLQRLEKELPIIL